MAALFADGRIVDLILALVVAEALALAVYHRVTGRGIPILDLLANLAAGACLMLALRAALVGAAPGWIALALIAALVAHGADLFRRWI